MGESQKTLDKPRKCLIAFECQLIYIFSIRFYCNILPCVPRVKKAPNFSMLLCGNTCLILTKIVLQKLCAESYGLPLNLLVLMVVVSIFSAQFITTLYHQASSLAPPPKKTLSLGVTPQLFQTLDPKVTTIFSIGDS